MKIKKIFLMFYSESSNVLILNIKKISNTTPIFVILKT